MPIKVIAPSNPLLGKIRDINQGPAVSEIKIDTPAGVITSVIAPCVLQVSGFDIGQQVQALFKTTGVSIATR